MLILLCVCVYAVSIYISDAKKQTNKKCPPKVCVILCMHVNVLLSIRRQIVVLVVQTCWRQQSLEGEGLRQEHFLEQKLAAMNITH